MGGKKVPFFGQKSDKKGLKRAAKNSVFGQKIPYFLRNRGYPVPPSLWRKKIPFFFLRNWGLHRGGGAMVKRITGSMGGYKWLQ